MLVNHSADVHGQLLHTRATTGKGSFKRLFPRDVDIHSHSHDNDLKSVAHGEIKLK